MDCDFKIRNNLGFAALGHIMQKQFFKEGVRPLKKTRELIGMPVLAVAEGDFVARVDSAIINPAERRIEYLLLNGKQWWMEKKCITFSDIKVGANAITIKMAADVKPVTQFGQAVKLLQDEAKELNPEVMTRDGRLLGTVGEFYFDESSGKITDYSLMPPGSIEPAGIIPAVKIITFSKRYLVVLEDTGTTLEKEPGTGRRETENPTLPAPETIPDFTPDSSVIAQNVTGSDEEKDPLELFSEKQRQYMIGKKAGKTIIDANGNIVVSEETVITEDIIDRALRVDKYVELTMFVE